MPETTTARLRNPRSVSLTKEELKALKQYRKKFKSNTDCAISLGLDRVVFDRVILVGSASFQTVQRIRGVFVNLLEENSISRNHDTNI